MHVPENNRFTGAQEMAQWVNSRLLAHFVRLRLSRIGSRYRFRVRPEMAKSSIGKISGIDGSTAYERGLPGSRGEGEGMPSEAEL